MSVNPPNVLLVDDEPWFREALAYSLEGRGVTCLVARDATEAMSLMADYMIAVLVTDIMMPAGHAFPGVEATETGFRLMEHVQYRWPGIPIVCLSVIGDQTKIDVLKRKGIRYLRKGEISLEATVRIIATLAIGRQYSA